MQVACSKHLKIHMSKAAHNASSYYNEGTLCWHSRLAPLTALATTPPSFCIFCYNVNTLCQALEAKFPYFKSTLDSYQVICGHRGCIPQRKAEDIIINCLNYSSQLISFAFQKDNISCKSLHDSQTMAMILESI